MNAIIQHLKSLYGLLFGGSYPLLAILAAIVTAWGYVMTYRSSIHTPVELRRLEEVVSPLFELLEPSMLANAAPPSDDAVRDVVNLIRSHSMLAGGRLRFFADAPSASLPARWPALCRYVSGQYDTLCRRFHIPRRSILYRIQRYQPRYAAGSIVTIAFRLLFNALSGAIIIVGFLALAGSLVTGSSEAVLPVIICLCAAITAFALSLPRA